MKKILFLVGFLLPLPAYFNDSVAGYIQDVGGSLWSFFYGSGFILYPVYLLFFTIPVFFILSLFLSQFAIHSLEKKKIFLFLLYGFLSSGVLFILLALLAFSQFNPGSFS